MPVDRESNSERPAAAAMFATTHWSVVLAAGQTQTAQSAAALAKLCRTKRYASAEALAEDLERWLRHEPIHARPTGPSFSTGLTRARASRLAPLAFHD